VESNPWSKTRLIDGGAPTGRSTGRAGSRHYLACTGAGMPVTLVVGPLMASDWDPDIARKRLSDGEKDGLQLYRNYSRAFEKHAIERFAAETDADKFDSRH